MADKEKNIDKNAMKNSKKRKSGLKIIRVVLIILAVIVLLLASALAFLYSKLGQLNREKPSYQTEYGQLNQEESGDGAEHEFSGQGENNRKEESDREDKIINIMLVGVDNDYLPGMDDRGNADGLMLMTINQKNKQIILTSLMRDSSISVPGRYNTKATLVYHDFGIDTLIDSIEYNFDIEIDNYVMVNYFGVMNVVDALGGLELEINAAEINGMQKKIENLNSLVGDPPGTDMLTAEDAGLRTLNGKQVAALLRIRNTGGNDAGRTARAREVILAAKDKACDLSLQGMNEFIDTVLSNITTDMSSTRILGLAIKVPSYAKYEFVSNRIPADGSYWDDGSFIYMDFDVNKKALHDLIYGPEE
jgi:LCP family protein required for cell wall assembly